MKKVMFIMAAALLMMTQCKKENETPTDPAEGTVKMTVTAGSGRTSIDTENGAITWSAGDKLYVSDGTNWLGSLTLVSEEGSAQGTFTGSIAGIGDGTTPCHFFYLGHDNGMTEPAGTAAASISFATQDGILAGAMRYHTGYGSTDVTVTEGEATGSVVMNTKIAIARIYFTTDGTQAYTSDVTMTGVSNTLSVSPDGSFSGSGEGGITIGGGTTGERYVTLIPTETTDVLNVSFTGDATGSMTFLAGISENKFYGMKDAMTVTLTPKKPEFSVGKNTTVEFAPGNLYWDGSAFHFEANQWDYSVGALSHHDEFANPVYNWDPSHVSHFYWSQTASVAYAEDYSDDDALPNDVFFTNSTEITANPNFQVNGEIGTNTWRTLSYEEWEYLLYYRDNAPSLRARVTLSDVSVYGLVILPDGTDASVMSRITSTADLETYGAVFLPAAGYRDGSDVKDVGVKGYYWSSTSEASQVSEFSAVSMSFDSGSTFMPYDFRYIGNAVRLVR